MYIIDFEISWQPFGKNLNVIYEKIYIIFMVQIKKKELKIF